MLLSKLRAKRLYSRTNVKAKNIINRGKVMFREMIRKNKQLSSDECIILENNLVVKRTAFSVCASRADGGIEERWFCIGAYG